MVTSVEVAGDEATVILRGDLDLSNAGSLRDALIRCVDSGATAITVDLAEVSFIDSSGINALCYCRRMLDRDGTMTLLHPSSPVRRVLEITGLTSLFVIVDA